MNACDTREWVEGDGDTRCQECGHAYLPWMTDSPLWNQTIGGQGATDDPGGYLCAACFMSRADAIHGPIIWRVVPMWKPVRP